jgi:hypothetical protein
VSTDHGHTWSTPRPIDPDIQSSTAGPHGSAFGKIGVVYTVDTSSTQYRISAATGTPAITCPTGETTCKVFATTVDQGVTWSRNVMAGVPGNNGSGYVAADPTRRDHYAVSFLPNSGSRLEIWETYDAGTTWSLAKTVTADTDKPFFKAGVGYAPNGALGAVWRVKHGTASGGTIGGIGGTPSEYDIVAMVSRAGDHAFSEVITLTDGPAPANTGGSDDCACNVSLTNDRMAVVWGDARQTDTNANSQRQLWFASFGYSKVRYGPPHA